MSGALVNAENFKYLSDGSQGPQFAEKYQQKRYSTDELPVTLESIDFRDTPVSERPRHRFSSETLHIRVF